VAHGRAGRRAGTAVLAAALAAGSVHAEPAVYLLDPDHSFVTFEVLHFGTSTIRGRFAGIDGFVELDRDARRGSVSLRLPPADVDTGVPAFDARLRGPDLLAVEIYRWAYFVASRVIFDGAAVAAVHGELTLRGVSRGLELRALRFGCYSHPLLRREVCGGDFEGELRRSDFGAGFGVPYVADRVRLLVQVEGIRR